MNQLFFLACAAILLGSVLVTANNVALNRQEVLISTEATITGTAIAQELIEEISVRKFDQYNSAPGQLATDSTTFSLIMGPDAGENQDSVSTLNDIDDFNGFKRTVVTPRTGNFVQSCKVYFIQEGSPDALFSTQTYLKRIDVTVRNSAIISPDSCIVVSKIVSYRYKG